MPEDITLAAPVRVDPGVTTFRVARLVFDWESALVQITLRPWSGSAFVGAHRIEATYEGAIATTLMIGLNKVNLGTPNRFVNTSQFGTITESSTPGRVLQINARLTL